MAEIGCIGVCTGGGDAPGLNAVIRAVVKSAILKYHWKVLGIPDGFDGLIWPERSYELQLKDVSGILPRGGTILGTTNRGNPFAYKSMDNGREVIQNAARLGMHALVVIGGDGTQNIALQLFRKGLKVVGVPKTIDNDLCATDITFGFDTALHTATDAVDKIHSTAESHHRVMLVEVMGRDAGWIALEAGIAGGAHIILIPEVPFTVESICRTVQARTSYGKHFTIVVVAEGVHLPAELQHMHDEERRRSPRSGAVANLIGDAIGRGTKKEVRVTVLGHIQRGGSPSPFDRILGTRFGVAATDLIARGEFGKMVCLQQSCVGSVEIPEAVGQLKLVDREGELVRAARAIGICFGD
jgi:6-phosphofructokinase 1